MNDGFAPHLDRIVLTGVQARGFHGVLPEERVEGQPFVVDVELGVPTLARAARYDDLQLTADYGAVASAIVAVVEGEPVQLIETLAVRIAQRCLDFEHVQAVRVTVHKPRAPIPVPFGDVAVRITRSR